MKRTAVVLVPAALLVLGTAGPVSAAPNPSERANPDVACQNVLSRNLNADPRTARNAEQGGANFLAVGIAFGCVESPSSSDGAPAPSGR